MIADVQALTDNFSQPEKVRKNVRRAREIKEVLSQ